MAGPKTDSAQALTHAVEDAAIAELQPYRLLLLGSAARGEESYGTIAGRTELFSDLEFYVQTRSRVDPTDCREFQQALGRIEVKTGYTNPFFHVEAPIRNERAFWLRQPFDLRISNFELLASGKVLYGPRLDRDRFWMGLRWIDLGSVQEIAMTRLWLQVLHTPIRFFEDGIGAFEEGIWQLYLNRNLLDVLTVHLPSQGELLAGYRARLARIREDPSLVDALGEDAVSIQEAALEAKLHVSFKRNLLDDYTSFLDQYVRLLWALIDEPLSPRVEGSRPGTVSAQRVGSGRESIGPLEAIETIPHLTRRLLSRRRRLFPVGLLMSLRDTRREAPLVRAHLRSKGLTGVTSWWYQDRKARITALLLQIHQAIHARLSERELPDLAPARQLIAGLTPPGQTFTWGHPGAASDPLLDLYLRTCAFMARWKHATEPIALTDTVLWRPTNV